MCCPSFRRSTTARSSQARRTTSSTMVAAAIRPGSSTTRNAGTGSISNDEGMVRRFHASSSIFAGCCFAVSRRGRKDAASAPCLCFRGKSESKSSSSFHPTVILLQKNSFPLSLYHHLFISPCRVLQHTSQTLKVFCFCRPYANKKLPLRTTNEKVGI